MLRKRKNNIILLFIFILIFTSCNEVNPINMVMQKITSVFVKDSPVKTAKSDIILLAQNDNNTENNKNEQEKAIDDSLTSDIISDSIINASFVVETYAYKSKYRRDPFISVLELQREGLEELEIETAKYYGMIKGKNGKMALFKDATGLGYVFYEGQKIKNGVLLKIEADSTIFKINEFGSVRNKVLRISKINEKSKK